MRNRCATARGFTLVELMVTLALVAIIMAVAVPSLTTFQRNAQLTSFSNTMLASINAARGEAMKRGMQAVVVPADGSNWSSGWMVFVDTNRNQIYNSTTDTIILQQPAPPSYLTITPNGTAIASPPYIMFDASGYARVSDGTFPSNQTFQIQRNDVSGDAQYAQTRLVKIAVTGRVRVCTPASSSDTTCSMTTSAL